MQLFRFGIKNVWVFQTSVVLGRDKLHVQHSALVYNDSEWINSMKYISTPVLSLLSRTEQKGRRNENKQALLVDKERAILF